MATQTMTFDLARLERFRQARNEARSADQDSFEFDGHPFRSLLMQLSYHAKNCDDD